MGDLFLLCLGVFIICVGRFAGAFGYVICFFFFPRWRMRFAIAALMVALSMTGPVDIRESLRSRVSLRTRRQVEIFFLGLIGTMILSQSMEEIRPMFGW